MGPGTLGVLRLYVEDGLCANILPVGPENLPSIRSHYVLFLRPCIAFATQIL